MPFNQKQFDRDIRRWLNEAHYIYTLSDPETGVIRYVGCTTSPATRESMHRSSRKGSAAAWVRALRDKGLFPVFTIIDSARGAESGRSKEIKWILYYAGLNGSQLLNQAHAKNNFRIRMNRGKKPRPSKQFRQPINA